jgi:hypothetical protein
MPRGLLLALMLQLGAASAETGKTLWKLRTTDRIVSEAIQAGIRESATFSSLVDVIERSNTIVYVARTLKLPHRMEGCLVHGPGNQRYPYLRVLLQASLPAEHMIAILGHELHHVREVLDAGVAPNQQAMKDLFARIGLPQLGTDGGEQYETREAQRGMEVIAAEVGASRRTRSLPNRVPLSFEAGSCARPAADRRRTRRGSASSPLAGSSRPSPGPPR